MKKSFIVTLTLGVFALVACQRENAPQSGDLREIKFTASVDGVTKATASAFEEGDRVGLTIGSPVNKNNVILVPDGRSLTAEYPLYWPADMKQSQEAGFIAYFPYEFSTYTSSFDATKNWVFGIGGDQYRSDVYRLQDYMSAVTSATPADDYVALTFKHLMSRFSITIENQLKTDTFKDIQADSFRSVEINQVNPWFEINFANQYVAADPDGGQPYTLAPAKIGPLSYSLILPPQTVSPEISITLSSGKKLTYKTASPITFNSGKRVSATLTLTDDQIVFNYTIEDWTDNPTEFTFVQVTGTPPDNEIWYTTTDGNIVTPNNADLFGATLVSNVYDGEKGIMTFDGPVTMIGDKNYSSSEFAPFENRRNLFSVSLPESVEILGYAAFYGCSSLESVSLPSHLSYMSDMVFAYTRIKSIHIPEIETLDPYGNPIGANCLYLSEITGPYASEDGRCLIVGSSVRAFAAADIESYSIPEGITEIGSLAFHGNYPLKSISFPSTLKIIKNQSFCSTALETLVIPEGVEEIGYAAFASCTSLTSVTIPTTASLSAEVFDNCISLLSFSGKYATEDGRLLVDGNRILAFASGGLTDYSIPEGIIDATDGFSGYRNLPELEVLTLPSTLKSLSLRAQALKTLTSFAEVPPSVRSDYYLYLPSVEVIFVPAGSVEAYKTAQCWSNYAEKIVAFPDQPFNEIWYTTADGSIAVPQYEDAFNANIISNTYENGKGVIVFDDNLTTIGNAAFWGATITSIQLPYSLKKIDQQAFGGCTSLETFDVPYSVTEISPYRTFSQCHNLSSFTGKFASDDGRALIVDGTMVGFAPYGLTEYSVDKSVIRLGSVFECCWNLTNIFLPDGLEIILNEAFESCSGLTQITLPLGLKSIGSYAFRGCSRLTRIAIPSNVEYIANLVFDGCESLASFSGKFASEDGHCLIYYNSICAFALAGVEEYVIPEGIYATCPIKGLSNLKRIVFPESLISLGQISYCYNLESITVNAAIPPSVEIAWWRGDDPVLFYSTNDCPIYVPAESVEAYKTAEYWSDYADRIQAISYPDYTENSPWSVIGTFSNWERDYPMWINGSLHVAKNISLSAGDNFKFRKNKDWEENFGMGSGVSSYTLGDYFDITQGGDNIVIAEDGVYDLILDPVQCLAKIVRL